MSNSPGKISKPSIVVTSLGRTGTLFFTGLMRDQFPSTYAIHEPDYLNFGQYRGTANRLRQLGRQIQESGFSNIILKKALGQWSLKAISDKVVRGEMDAHTAVNHIINQRHDFIATRPGNIYVECSSACYGLIALLPDVFDHHRVVYLVRDGRDWIRSMLNFQSATIYDKGRLRALISPDWPTAGQLPHDPYHQQWVQMSLFEKLCWAWSRLNASALDAVEQNRSAHTFYFEAIFSGDERYRHLSDLLHFAFGAACDHPEAAAIVPPEGCLENRMHQSNQGNAAFPAWDAWTPQQKQQFAEICGPLMERLGYRYG